MAAKNKKKGGRQGLFSKALNVGLIVLGFSRVIEHLMAPADFKTKMRAIKRDATFGLSEGKFNLQNGLSMYTPGVAAIALGSLKSYLLKKFPVRR